MAEVHRRLAGWRPLGRRMGLHPYTDTPLLPLDAQP